MSGTTYLLYFVIGYALVKQADREKTFEYQGSTVAAAGSIAAILIVLVGVLTWVIITQDRHLPRIIGPDASSFARYIVRIIMCAFGALALALLWRRRRSVLDLWLIVGMFAFLFEAVRFAFDTYGRFSLGFYAVRIYALTTAVTVLLVLLSETTALYMRLTRTNARLSREQDNKLMNAEAVVATLAHEVRQPLAGMTNAPLRGSDFSIGAARSHIDKAKALFDQISDAAFRANEVFENFRTLFRGGKQEHQPVDLNVLALEAVELLRKDLDDHNVVAHTMLAPELPAIQGNRSQLREVILNLLQNSIEAMATTTRQRVISVVTARHDPDLISVSLQDTGPGIDPDKLTSIFDAFVTTKAKGTGLGLAICKMIIEQHGGKLSAETDAHYGGARFEVTLPTKAATVEMKTPASSEVPKQV